MAKERQILEIVADVSDAVKPLKQLQAQFETAARRMQNAIAHVDFDPASEEAKQLRKDVTRTGRAFADFADKAEGGQTKASRSVRKLADDFDDVDKASSKAVRSMKKFGPQIITAVSAASALVAVGLARELTRVAVAAFKVERRFIGYRSALASATGDTESANAEFEIAAEIAERYGLNLNAVAKNYGVFTVAATKAGLSLQDSRQLFTGLAASARALGLSNEDLSASLKAVQQIASKGRVSLEELTGQLGERLPGALRIMADGLGKTVPELIKLVETGKVTSETLAVLGPGLLDTFGEQAQRQAGTLAAEVERVGNQVTLAGEAFAAGFSDDIAEAIRRISGGVGDLQANARVAGEVLGFLANVSLTLGQAVGKELTGEFGVLVNAVATTTEAVLNLISAAGQLIPGFGDTNEIVEKLADAAGKLAAKGEELSKSNDDIGDSAKRLVEDYKRFNEGLEEAALAIATQRQNAEAASKAVDGLTDATKGASDAALKAKENVAKLGEGSKKAEAPILSLAEALVEVGEEIREAFTTARAEINALAQDLTKSQGDSESVKDAKENIAALEAEQAELAKSTFLTADQLERQSQIVEELAEAGKSLKEARKENTDAVDQAAAQQEIFNKIQESAAKLAEESKTKVRELKKEYEKFGIDGVTPTIDNLDLLIERLEGSAESQSASLSQLELFTLEMEAQVDVAKRNIDAAKRQTLSLEDATKAAEGAGLVWDETTRTLKNLGDETESAAEKQEAYSEEITVTGKEIKKVKKELDEVYTKAREELETLIPLQETYNKLLDEMVEKLGKVK